MNAEKKREEGLEQGEMDERDKCDIPKKELQDFGDRKCGRIRKKFLNIPHEPVLLILACCQSELLVVGSWERVCFVRFQSPGD